MITSLCLSLYTLCVCVCVCVCACMRACVCACVCVCASNAFPEMGPVTAVSSPTKIIYHVRDNYHIHQAVKCIIVTEPL